MFIGTSCCVFDLDIHPSFSEVFLAHSIYTLVLYRVKKWGIEIFSITFKALCDNTGICNHLDSTRTDLLCCPLASI
jgi:hypothetical protein